MSHIVELVGSPGVGKSTIYKQLEKKWKVTYSWIPYKYLFPRKNKSLSFYTSFLTELGISKNLADVDVDALREAGDRFVGLYPEYMDACWNNINTRQKKHLNGLDLRFAKTHYLRQLIQKIQCIKEAESSKIAIVDEGLIHSIYNGLYWSENEEDEKKEIKALLNIIPLPKALISVETPFTENIRRLLGRKKVLSMHKSLMVSDLENIIQQNRAKRYLINNIIQEHNIPLLIVNSSQPPEDSASKIIQFVSGLS